MYIFYAFYGVNPKFEGKDNSFPLELLIFQIWRTCRGFHPNCGDGAKTRRGRQALVSMTFLL